MLRVKDIKGDMEKINELFDSEKRTEDMVHEFVRKYPELSDRIVRGFKKRFIDPLYSWEVGFC